MPMFRVLPLFFFSFISISLSAQRAEFKVVLPSEVSPIITNGFFFKAIEIDSTVGKVIGSAQIGMKKRRVEAILEEAPNISFLRVSNQLVPPSRGAMPLKLIITHIRVDEVTTLSSEKGTARLAVQIIRENKLGEDAILYIGDTIVTQFSLVDVSNDLGNLISEALATIIQDFSSSNWRDNIESGLSSSEQASSLASVRLPHFTSPIKEGVYLTPADLLARNPSERPFEINTKKSNYARGFKLFYNDKQKFVPAFVVFQDSVLYISDVIATGGQAQKRLLTRLTFDYPYSYCEIEMTDPVAQSFGMIGAAIGTNRYGVILDIRSGNTTVLTDQTLDRLTEEHTDLRIHITENKKMRPIGSRKIVEALNKRFSEVEE